ncbi:MAG: DNA internalization-related competence protein ComEC/Rec2 [Butyrivibrio sp.]|nr:DNA internalization-related competence protein ComEC/Rec2 [Butyrivibrio sp.]
MKRPLFVFSIVITAIVYIYLELFLSDYLMDYPDSFDGSFISVTGQVTKKEFKVDFLGEITPVVYITPVDASIGKNKYIALYMDTEDYREPCIGESVMIRGNVKLFNCARNPGEFDSRLYYATLKTAYGIKNARIVAGNGKVNYIREAIYRVRYYLESVLDKCLSTEDSSIMKAILLGDKAFMNEESKDLYKNNGIIHILAVSGLHISLLGMGLYELLRRLKIKVIPASVMAMIFMCLYGQMCGMSSSAFRAIAMFSMRMLAPMVKRTYDMLSALAVAFLMLLVDQPILLYNSGFLFSFGAIIGISLVRAALEPMTRIYKDEKMKFADDPEEPRLLIFLKKVLSGLLVSASIFLVTLPVYMCFYYTYPIYSVVLNLLVLPLMAPLMIAGIICMLAGGIWPLLGTIPGVFIHFILKVIEALCNVTWKIPGKIWFMGHGDGLKIWIYMSALCFFVFSREILMDKKTEAKNKNRIHGKEKTNREGIYRIADVIRYAFLGIAFFLLIINIRPELRITMIDVDQGDGILIQSGQESILIDGGSTGKKNVGKYSIIPYLKYQGVGEIDAVIITHEDQDHVSGVFEILDDMEKGGVRIKNLVLPNVSDSSRGDNYRKLEDRAKDLKVPVSYISCGQHLKVNRTEFICINPEKAMTTEGANAYSTVLYMKHGGFSALFTGDVEKEGQQHILKDIKADPDMFNNLTMLKVAHHGSMYTTDEEFLSLLNPKIAFISCGRENRYGHPHEDTLRRLESIGTTVYRTDISGAVCLEITGKRMKIKSFL